MLQKIYLMVFERYIPELKKYDSFSFLHQPMAPGQPLKIVQRHMAHPVFLLLGLVHLHFNHQLFFDTNMQDRSIFSSKFPIYRNGNFGLVFGRGEILLTYMIFAYHWTSRPPEK